ncbi:response regulator [Paenibacillus sp. J5C_2022]|uniref:response regulator n=1 Tax=Paenibacillus sp. J5C2022 TaxID=2977129 RepID=UPI0021D2D537|nr:response regulator [Paenibacillus sp. J5C2022]MCU6711360.1 response regulator [Paenibacillus sp. J5C2022]
MYRVLIAEDEILVRLGLKHSIDWSKYGMQVIADVANGEEAWSLFSKEMPDVVITDLKMPMMGGMELIAKIRSVNSHTRIVILTCLEEFKLAREALALDVSDYIVKLSMTTEQMEAVLAKMEGELRLRDTPSRPFVPLPDAAAAKEGLFKDYLFLHRYSAEEFGDKAACLSLSLSPRRMVMCMMEIDPYERLQQKFKDNKGQLIRLSLLNVLEEMLKSYDCCEAFHDSGSRYVILFSFGNLTSEKEADEELHLIIEHVRKVLATYFNVSVSFGISSRQDGYDKLKSQYRECAEALEDAFVGGPNRNYTYCQSRSKAVEEEAAAKLYRVEEIWERSGISYREACKEQISRYMKAHYWSARTEVRKLFAQLLHSPLLSLRLADEEMSARCSYYAERISGAKTLDQMIDEYECYVGEIVRKLREQKRTSPAVAQVLRFVEERYADSISLQAAADSVLMNANYVSTIFKKEMGINFIDYLLHFRVEKAKELFLNSSLKAYEIGERTGFTNHSHFSRVFKKYTGLGPREFRRRWVGDSAIEDTDDEE